VLIFGGQLGYLSMKSHGLAIGINLLLGERWGLGLPTCLPIRRLLDNAGSVDDAIAVLLVLQQRFVS
jgi:predicted choloylglycine hydrolase